jgi:hypothetical protein
MVAYRHSVFKDFVYSLIVTLIITIQTQALDRTATGIGMNINNLTYLQIKTTNVLPQLGFKLISIKIKRSILLNNGPESKFISL